MNNETKVGLLVALAFGALAWLSIQSGHLNLGFGASAERELKTAFSDVSGLTEGAMVKVAGVQVGQVSKIVLQPNGTAEVRYTVKSNIPLPSGVIAEIQTNGLIGDKFLALVVSVPGTTVLSADTKVIPGRGAADAANMTQQFAKVSDDLQAITGTLRGVLGNPDSAEKLQKIIDGFASLGGNLEGNGGNMINNFNETAASLARITARLERGEGTLGQLLMGKGGQGDMLGDLSSAMKDFKQLMAKVNNGEGTLGKLVNDPQTAEKLNTALDTFSDVSQRIDQIRTEIGFEGTSLVAENGIGGGKGYVTLQTRPTRFYTLAAETDGFASKAKDQGDPNNAYRGLDFGSRTKVTAQLGQIYKGAGLGNEDIALRIGLKKNTGGIGADTSIPLTGIPYAGDRKVKFSADVYDFGGTQIPNSNQPQVDVAARMDLVGTTLYGVAGYDNLLNSQYGSPKVGLGLKFQDDDLKYLAVGKAL